MSVRMSFGMKNVHKLKSVIDKLEKQIPGALSAAQRQEAEDIMRESVQMAPRLTGELVSSKFVRKKGRGYELGYDAPHATYLHEGYRGGFIPPKEPFQAWAGMALGSAKLGYVVARAKGAMGQKPLKFLERPIKRRIPSMGKRWKKHMLANMNLD